MPYWGIKWPVGMSETEAPVAPLLELREGEQCEYCTLPTGHVRVCECGLRVCDKCLGPHMEYQLHWVRLGKWLQQRAYPVRGGIMPLRVTTHDPCLGAVGHARPGLVRHSQPKGWGSLGGA